MKIRNRVGERVIIRMGRVDLSFVQNRDSNHFYLLVDVDKQLMQQAEDTPRYYGTVLLAMPQYVHGADDVMLMEGEKSVEFTEDKIVGQFEGVNTLYGVAQDLIDRASTIMQEAGVAAVTEAKRRQS